MPVECQVPMNGCVALLGEATHALRPAGTLVPTTLCSEVGRYLFSRFSQPLPLPLPRAILLLVLLVQCEHAARAGFHFWPQMASGAMACGLQVRPPGWQLAPAAPPASDGARASGTALLRRHFRIKKAGRSPGEARETSSRSCIRVLDYYQVPCCVCSMPPDADKPISASSEPVICNSRPTACSPAGRSLRPETRVHRAIHGPAGRLAVTAVISIRTHVAASHCNLQLPWPRHYILPHRTA